MANYKIVNIPSSINQDQCKEVLELFEAGYDIYKEYVFTDNAVIIFCKLGLYRSIPNVEESQAQEY